MQFPGGLVARILGFPCYGLGLIPGGGNWDPPTHAANKQIVLKKKKKTGVGRKFMREGNMYTYGWFMLLYGRNQQHCKAIILQLKIKKKN